MACDDIDCGSEKIAIDKVFCETFEKFKIVFFVCGFGQNTTKLT